MKENPVNTEAIKIGYDPVAPRRKIQFEAFKMQYGPVNYGIPVHVPLKEKEYNVLQRETGKKINEYLTKLINSKKYNNTKDQSLRLYYFKEKLSYSGLLFGLPGLLFGLPGLRFVLPGPLFCLPGTLLGSPGALFDTWE